MWRTVPLASLLFATLISRDGLAQASGGAALEAESLMVEAMGGREAWESARYFDFVWAVERPNGSTFRRRHVWDRWTGRYRLEMPHDGGQLVAYFDTESRNGSVWIDGRRLAGDTVRTLLDRAYGAHINDVYWLLMPFKWRDPGVSLTHRGSVTAPTGRRWVQIELTFDSVGLTPDNLYNVYLDPDSHLIGWWEHFRHRADTTTNTRNRWEGWERRGPLVVSLSRPSLTGRSRIFFPEVAIGTAVVDGVFTEPTP